MFGGNVDSLDDETITFPIDQCDDALFAKFGVFSIDNLDRVAAEDVPFGLFGGFFDLRFDLGSFGKGGLHEFFHYFCSGGHGEMMMDWVLVLSYLKCRCACKCVCVCMCVCL